MRMSFLIKSFLSLLCFILSIIVAASALADINWKEMSDEEVVKEINAGLVEYLRRGENKFELGQPVLIQTEDGSYTLTIDGAHILHSTLLDRLASEKGSDCVVISVQGVCDNIDWLPYKSLNYDYTDTYQIQKAIVVMQDGFALEILGLSGAVEDGMYEVGAEIKAGVKKRISMLYYALKDAGPIGVVVPGCNKPVVINLE